MSTLHWDAEDARGDRVTVARNERRELGKDLFDWNTPTDPYFVINGRAGECDDDDGYEVIADAILASNWLAHRDRRVRAEAQIGLLKGLVAEVAEGHYQGEVEVIDANEAWGLKESAYLAHVVRYVARAGKKTPDARADLLKARDYLHRELTGEWPEPLARVAPSVCPEVDCLAFCHDGPCPGD